LVGITTGFSIPAALAALTELGATGGFAAEATKIYTEMGHTAESCADPLFRQHLVGAIRWAAGM
jgi:hypothetical protein